MNLSILINALSRRQNPVWSRRRLLQASGMSVVGIATGESLSAAGQKTADLASAVERLSPTPECGDGTMPMTQRQTAGPFYTPNTPARANLIEPNMKGTPIVINGIVINMACEPVAKARLDFWQADAEGAYDNQGYMLRGHQYADDNGYYRLKTVMPGLYPGRTRHIHVSVRAPGDRTLTTQLYFPNESQNRRDAIYDKRLEVYESSSPAKGMYLFHFVLKA